MPCCSAIWRTLTAAFTAEAKRASAKPVAPVESDGIRYSAIRNGLDQYVAATDIATGRELWKVRIFHTHTKPWVERDVQWVFITDLNLADGSLFVRDEKARCYVVLTFKIIEYAELLAAAASPLKNRAPSMVDSGVSVVPGLGGKTKHKNSRAPCTRLLSRRFLIGLCIRA